MQQAPYVYNHLGQQVLRTVWQGGVAQKTVAVHDQWGHRIAEYDSATGALLREYVWLPYRPVAIARAARSTPSMSTTSAGR